MYPRRRFSSSHPREYADLLADAMGEGSDAETARRYGNGGGPLRRLLSSRYEDDEPAKNHSNKPTND